MVATKDLDFWIDNEYNVLFVGEAGVGKTSMVLDSFDRKKLNWQYYSASTMDPWVDLVGVPKEVKDKNGEPVLDLIKPRQWQEDQVEALFIDEFNRAHKKVRNAIMELIQFKSINGKSYKNLKVVWAAINPEESDMDNEYDVEQLDPAQKDRFHFHVEIPYKPVLSYFQKKYGKPVANPAVEWWNTLPKDMKRNVSPRRLDYAIDIHSKGGKLEYALPKKSNIGKLVNMLGKATYLAKLMELEKQGDTSAISKWLSEPNNYFNVQEYVWKTKESRTSLVPLLPSEEIAAGLSANKQYMNELKRLDNDVVKETIANINKTNKRNEKKAKAFRQKRFRTNFEKLTKKEMKSAKILHPGNAYLLQRIQHDANGYNTQQRMKVVTGIKQLCCEPSQLDPADARRILYALIIVINRSQLSTIRSRNIVRYFNHLVYSLNILGELDFNKDILNRLAAKKFNELAAEPGCILK